MKRLIIFLFLASGAWGQSFYHYENILLNQVGQPIVGVNVWVCTGNVTPLFTGNPPCTLATVYSDQAGSLPIAQPITTSPLGNYGFYVSSPNTYTLAFSGNGITNSSDVLTIPVVSGAVSTTATNLTGPGAITGTFSGTSTLTGNITQQGTNSHSGTETFTGALNANGGGALNGSFSGPTTLPAVIAIDGCQHVNANQTFAQALAVGGVTCINIDPGTFSVSANATVPSTVGLSFSKGGVLSIANAVTLTVNSPIYASPDAQIFTYTGTGVALLGGPNAVVSVAWFPGADICAQINNALLALQNGGGNAGGFIDARHYSGNQPCASNPFAGITIPFDLQTGFYSITLSVPWIHSGAQQIVEGYVNANPATLLASASWPVATISTSTLTSNVITIVTASAHSYTSADIGNAVALFGQSDATLDGVYAIRSVADNTHLTVNSPLSNRSATGGTATRPMIQIGTLSVLNLSETGYRGVNLNGNSVVRVVYYNPGEELTGLRRSIVTNFMARAIYAGGTDAGTGAGNHYYDDLHLLWASGADSVVSCIEAKNIASTQPIGIYNATCARNGGAVTAANAFFLNASSASINKVHTESCTNAVQMKSNGISFLSEIANSNCAVTLLMDSLGEQVSANILQGGATSTVVNNLTGHTITGNLTLYDATSNGGEVWQKDDGTKTLVVSGMVPATAGTGDLGAALLPYGNLWLGTAATNNFKFQPAATAAARIIQIADPGATSGLLLGGTNLTFSPTAPTIAGAGCGGTVAAIQNANGTASFNIFTGTAPTSGGCTITMPAATTDWHCEANHVSAISTTNFIIQQTGALSTTSVTLQLFSDVAAATAPAASDTWRVTCTAN